MPKVSIIIPVYNMEKYISKCLDSVINQTLKDIEIIIIDDCSTDNSVGIINEYLHKDKRIKFIQLNENSGVSIARNRGIEIAQGEYLGFVDSDDEVDLNFYEELYKKAKKSGADITKAGCKIFELDGSVSISTLNSQIKESKYNFIWQWWCAIYKNLFLKENDIRFKDKIIKSQDAVFLTEAIFACNYISLIDNVYYKYYRREGSLDADKIPIKSYISAFDSLEARCDIYNSSDIFTTNKNLYNNLYFDRIKSGIMKVSFKNDSYEAKEVCAEYLIRMFYKSKDVDYLISRLKNRKILKYFIQKDKDKLAKFLYKSKTRLDLLNPWYKNLFQIKNDKGYKYFSILGMRWGIKRSKK